MSVAHKIMCFQGLFKWSARCLHRVVRGTAGRVIITKLAISSASPLRLFHLEKSALEGRDLGLPSHYDTGTNRFEDQKKDGVLRTPHEVATSFEGQKRLSLVRR